MMKLIKVLAIPISLVMGTPVLGDWVYDMTSENCSPEARRIVADSTRNQIEHSVRRAEASIEAPTPIGDMSCLAGLMQLPLGSFASTGNLGGLFGTSLQSLFNPNGNFINQYCARAEREWRKATRSLGRNTGSSNNYKLPSYFNSRIIQATTDPVPTENQLMGSEVDSPTSGISATSSYQTISNENTPPNNGVQQGVPLDADQSIEGIWDTIYGKELDQ